MTYDIANFRPAVPGPGEDLGPASQTLSYVDKRGRPWLYWPLSAADQMWREVMCNQFECDRPATFVGVRDIHGDGTEYFDGAAAWCYWCMPREHMNSEARRAAEHADWARRVTGEECAARIKKALYKVPEGSIPGSLESLPGDIRSATESREAKLAYACVPEIYETRELEAVRRYERRPKEDDLDYPFKPAIPDWE